MMSSGLAGKYRLEVKRPDGSVRLDTGWFDNLITTAGLNGLATTTNQFVYCQVGSGSGTPTDSDVVLGAQVASSNTSTLVTEGATASEPYYSYFQRKWTFAVGVATGNLTEVGVGPQVSGSLFSRSLITFGGRSTTVTVLPDESLEVTYELRVYAPTTDTTGTFMIGPDSYNYALRAARVTSWASAADTELGKAIQGPTEYPGGLGAVTGEPTGTPSISSAFITFPGYTYGTLYQDSTFFWTYEQGNVGGGIAALMFTTEGLGTYQIAFSPALPKNDTRSLSLTVRVSWARYGS